MIPAEVADDFFHVAADSLVRRRGNVSFVKYVGATTDEDARQIWLDAVDRFLSAFPAGAFTGFDISSGGPVLQFAGGLDVRIEVWRLHEVEPADGAWEVIMNPHYVSVIIEAIGCAMWGEEWVATVRRASQGASVPVVYAVEEDRWIAQSRPQPGFWPSFAHESRARRAAVALAIGAAGMSELFDDWRSRASA
ncbi:hypothetical protein LK09_02490 [Microbacterium mangrovi]|uniref:Uncharacterized protein n=2 Tax=Microbacterium mangrovi TaxID=1348253 RepID=A0A0B2A8U3_9MICO|nr:hypothetical protein LK09_02490 [Microbacterium mangrovi]